MTESRVEFPACAGMNRHHDDSNSQEFRVPRMRGDEPNPESLVDAVDRSSPHARG